MPHKLVYSQTELQSLGLYFLDTVLDLHYYAVLNYTCKIKLFTKNGSFKKFKTLQKTNA